MTRLLLEAQIINLHPWEYNEVLVMLGAALRENVPIIDLHLTRPPIEIPNRAQLGLPSYFEAARGAYVVQYYEPGRPRGRTVIVQGISAMVGILKVLPDLVKYGLNVKIIRSTSPQLFALQPAGYRLQVLSPGDRMDSTVITTQTRWLMHDWLFNNPAEEYALSADWDNRWRTGGTVDEVLGEANLSPDCLMEGISRFVRERPVRLARLQSELDDAQGYARFD